LAVRDSVYRDRNGARAKAAVVGEYLGMEGTVGECSAFSAAAFPVIRRFLVQEFRLATLSLRRIQNDDSLLQNGEKLRGSATHQLGQTAARKQISFVV